MSKAEEIKAKLLDLRGKIQEKLAGLDFLNKLRVKKSDKPTEPANPYRLAEIFRSGDILTKIKIVFIYIFMLVGFVAIGMAGRKILERAHMNQENENLKKEYADGFEAMKERIQSNASLVSVGSITANAYSEEDKDVKVRLDLWVRTNDPLAAEFVQKNDVVLNDQASQVLGQLKMEQIDLLSDEGKEVAKERILKALNSSMKKGKIVELFFNNFVVQ